MSPSSLSVVLSWIDAANRKDGAALLDLSDPDIEIVGPRGSVRGSSVLLDWIDRAGLMLENKRAFAREGAVVVEHHGVWRSVDTGEFVGEAEVVSRFDVADGSVTAFERFDGLSEALRAAGLKESDAVVAV